MAIGFKEAKILVSLELAKFQAGMKDLKNRFGDINAIKLDGPAKGLERNDLAIKQLKDHVGGLKGKIVNLKKEMAELAKTGDDAFHSENISSFVREIGLVNEKITKANFLMKELGGNVKNIRDIGGAGVGGGIGAGGAGGRGKGGLMQYFYGPRGAIRGLMPLRLLGAAGAMAMAVMAVRQQAAIGREERQFRAITGITEDEPIETLNIGGFTGAERRKRAADIALAAGKVMSKREVERRLQRSERYEIMTGVKGETQAALLGATRRAGISESMTPKLIKQAWIAGIKDSRMIEYFESMTESLTSLSEGVNIDSRSITALSGSLLSTSDFFKSDPRRVGRAIQSLDQMFKGGDRFQQAQAARAIYRANPDATIAGAEIRAKLGLFANISLRERDKFGNLKGGPLTEEEQAFEKTLRTSGLDILKNVFKEIQEATRNAPLPEQAFRFMSSIGMMNQGGLALFKKMRRGEDITEIDMEKAIKASVEMEQKLIDQMKALGTKFGRFANTFESITKDISRTLVKPLVNLNEPLTSLAASEGPFGKEAKKVMETAPKFGPAALIGPVYDILQGIFGTSIKEEEKKIKEIESTKSVSESTFWSDLSASVSLLGVLGERQVEVLQKIEEKGGNRIMIPPPVSIKSADYSASKRIGAGPIYNF